MRGSGSANAHAIVLLAAIVGYAAYAVSPSCLIWGVLGTIVLGACVASTSPPPKHRKRRKRR